MVQYTVSMKYLTIISGQLHLLHQFKSDFAHLLALDNLVIELINAKNEQNRSQIGGGDAIVLRLWSGISYRQYIKM